MNNTLTIDRDEIDDGLIRVEENLYAVRPLLAQSAGAEDAFGSRRLIQHQPAWALHALMRLRRLPYTCENQPLLQSLGQSLPVVVDGHFVWGEDDAFAHYRQHGQTDSSVSGNKLGSETTSGSSEGDRNDWTSPIELLSWVEAELVSPLRVLRKLSGEERRATVRALGGPLCPQAWVYLCTLCAGSVMATVGRWEDSASRALPWSAAQVLCGIKDIANEFTDSAQLGLCRVLIVPWWCNAWRQKILSLAPILAPVPWAEKTGTSYSASASAASPDTAAETAALCPKRPAASASSRTPLLNASVVDEASAVACLRSALLLLDTRLQECGGGGALPVTVRDTAAEAELCGALLSVSADAAVRASVNAFEYPSVARCIDALCEKYFRSPQAGADTVRIWASATRQLLDSPFFTAGGAAAAASSDGTRSPDVVSMLRPAASSGPLLLASAALPEPELDGSPTRVCAVRFIPLAHDSNLRRLYNWARGLPAAAQAKSPETPLPSNTNLVGGLDSDGRPVSDVTVLGACTLSAAALCFAGYAAMGAFGWGGLPTNWRSPR